MVDCRQAIWIRIPEYLNSAGEIKQRPFLIMTAGGGTDEVSFLNITSSESASHRSLFSSDIHEITNYRPPFSRKSFADTSGVYVFDYCTGMESLLLSNGELLNEREFTQIVDKTNFRNIKTFQKTELMMLNTSFNY